MSNAPSHPDHHHAHASHAGHGEPPPAGKVLDPVCGMTVDPETTAHRAEFDGKPFFFCSAGCRTKFVAEPARYLDGGKTEAPVAPAGTVYTCPMHPEIRQVGPGSCPICGMALEPELVTAASAPNPELTDFTRRFWIGLALSVPVLALEMGGHLTGLMMSMSGQTSAWIQFALATPVVLWSGWPFFEREHLGVLTGSPITDMRITLLTGRAHLKHTEGGDFRQATYRAIRQGLMEAKKKGDCRLLEPWYGFRLEVPQDMVGHAMADIQRMSGTFDTPTGDGEYMVLNGTAPVSEMRDYAMDVNAYTHGRGHLSCVFAGYQPCHNADEVIENMAYDPESDLENTPDSVFCAHGAGYPVKWYKVPEFMHLDYAWDGMRE